MRFHRKYASEFTLSQPVYIAPNIEAAQKIRHILFQGFA